MYIKGFYKILFMILCLFLIFAPKTWADYDVYLRAEAINKTLPDGTVVPMWGFARDTAFEAHDGTVTIPGPVITVPENENNVRIFLENNLPVPISIIIPGQSQKNDGGPVRNSSGRIQSFSHETPPGNTVAVIYRWDDFKNGTFVYHSATDPSIQVPMGLYGVIKKDSSSNVAYGPQSSYSNEAVFVFSEIDTDLNNQVAQNPGVGTISSIGYEPKYYLLNGQPFVSEMSAIDLGASGNTKLLRLVNIGNKDRVITIPETKVKVVAEDGNEYVYYKEAMAIMLAAGQTKDVIFTPSNPGYFTLLDRRLALSNYSNTTGGLLAYLKVSSLTQFGLNVTISGTGAGKVIAVSKPGGISCGTDCSENYNANTDVRLKAIPNPGSVFSGWTGDCAGTGDCEVTLSLAKSVTASFTTISKIALTAPNGGEILQSGSPFFITWNAPLNVSKASLYYSINNGLTWTLIEKNVTGSKYYWTVPVVPNNTIKAKIKAIGYDNLNRMVGQDSSDLPFKIEVVKLTSPNSTGLVFASGLPWTITWETYLTRSPVTRVLLQYSTNGGFTWKTFATINGNPGTYTGTVPFVTSTTTKGRVKVVLQSGTRNVNVGTDISDFNFTINP